MNYDIGIIIIILLIIGIIVGCYACMKRPMFVSIIVSIPLIIFEIIKYCDKSYYEDMVEGYKNTSYITFLISLLLFLILICEICVNILVGVKIKNKSKALSLMMPFENKYEYSNLLNIDIAYFDTKTNKYILNKHFVNTLGLNTNLVSLKDLFNVMLPLDKEEYLKSNNELIKFRLMTKDGFVWYEEKRQKENGLYNKVIYKSDSELSTNDLLVCYKDLEKYIKNE